MATLTLLLYYFIRSVSGRVLFCSCLQELPASGLSIERELDEVVPVLLKKAGDLSTAGAYDVSTCTYTRCPGLSLGAISVTVVSNSGRGSTSGGCVAGTAKPCSVTLLAVRRESRSGSLQR